MVQLTLNEWLEDPASMNNPCLQVIASLIYMKEGNVKEALRCVRKGTTLEQ